MKPIEYIRSNQTPIKHVKLVVRTSQFIKSLLMLTVTKDGSIVVDPSPYFPVGNWRWGMYEIPAGRVDKDTVDMLPGTRLSSSNMGPKFTYHRSGWVTAGKTGHITGNRILATPLSQASGHIFTLQVKGFTAFIDADITRKKYIHIIPRMPENLETLKIVGSIGNLEDFVTDKGDPKYPEDHPSVRYIKQVGTQQIEVSLFRIVLDNGQEKWLMLEYWPNFPYNVTSDKPSLSLLTGWVQEDAMDKTKPFKCLGILAG